MTKYISKNLDIVKEPIKTEPKYLSEVKIIEGFWRGYKGIIIDHQPGMMFFPKSYEVRFRVPGRFFPVKTWFTKDSLEVIEA
jgi:hypothetical protein